MGAILLTWELGGGIGHLMNLRPIGEALVKRGHRVIAVVRDLTHTREAFKDTGIACTPAPVVAPVPSIFHQTQGLAHVLANSGLGYPQLLEPLLAAWQTLLDLVKPDLVVADHSPIALLALWGRAIPKANIGLGFFCPPATFPLPHWLGPHEQHLMPRLVEDERRITKAVNDVLKTLGQPSLSHLGQIYGQVEETILATYPEFDHFGPRPQATYWGHWPHFPGIAPPWPAGSGPRIYGYLKPFPMLEPLLDILKRSGHPTIIYASGISPVVQSRYQSASLQFEGRPLDLKAMARECDLAILHAGHGTTASMLLAGKPVLLFPLYTEQLLFSRKVQEIRAGRVVVPSTSQTLPEVFRDVLHNPAYRQNATIFADRYPNAQKGEQIPAIVERLEKYLSKC